MTLDTVDAADFRLHIADPEVDHPEVLVSWCFSRALYARMTQESFDREPILLVSMRKKDDVDGHAEVRTVIRNLDTGARILSFPAPGSYVVSAILLSSSVSKNHAKIIQNKFLSGGYGSKFAYHFPDLDVATQEDLALFAMSMHYSSFRACATLEVNILAEGFAKPPHPWVKAWVTAYVPAKLKDQCDFNRRLIFFAIPIQPFLYPVWEGIKRISLLIVTLGLMVIGQGDSREFLKLLFQKQLVFSWPGREIKNAWNYQGWDFWHRPIVYLIPALLLCNLYAAVTRQFWNIPYLREISALIAILTVGALCLAAVLVVIFLFVYYILNPLLRYTEAKIAQKPAQPAKASAARKKRARRITLEEREQRRIALEAEKILSGATVPLAVCLPGTDEVARGQKILKQAPITLKFRNLKRAVCRPFM